MKTLFYTPHAVPRADAGLGGSSPLWVFCWLAAWLGVFSAVHAQSPGSVDTTFNSASSGLAGTLIRVVVSQSDGKVLVGGNSTDASGTATGRIARLNPDGSLDTSFNASVSSGKFIYTMALQSDGKVLIGGQFTSINGGGPANLARLNTDGSVDTSFNANLDISYVVYSVALQSDGKVLIAGAVPGLYPLSSVLRRNANGSGDSTFAGPRPNSSILSTAQGDDKVFIGGAFYQINNAYQYYVARLNSNGALDSSFYRFGAYQFVRAVVPQSDGKVLVAGYNLGAGSLLGKIIRLNTDGTLDPGFSAPDFPNAYLYSAALQNDGKVLVGGSATGAKGVVRFNTDGSSDTTFNPGQGPNDVVYSVALQSDGKVLIGGSFTSVDGVACTSVARLYGDQVTAAIPTILSGRVDTLQTSSALAHVAINPQGSATDISFQYGPTIDYGRTTATQHINFSPAATVSAPLSGLAPGTLYHYRAVATNSVATAYGDDGTFTTLSIAQGWRQQYFGTVSNTGSAADGADPDGDGISNLLERALGLNPTKAGTAGLPLVARDAETGRLTLSATKGASSSDLTFSAEASADLVNWSAADVTVLVNTSAAFQARDDGPTSGRRFLRLRVSAP